MNGLEKKLPPGKIAELCCAPAASHFPECIKSILGSQVHLCFMRGDRALMHFQNIHVTHVLSPKQEMALTKYLLIPMVA